MPRFLSENRNPFIVCVFRFAQLCLAEIEQKDNTQKLQIHCVPQPLWMVC